MKKALSILIVSVLLLGLMSITAMAAPDVDHIAYASGESPYWKAVYVPIDNYAVSQVKDCEWVAAEYRAKLPADLRAFEFLYINGGDPNHIAATSETHDIGLVFTAPEKASYTLSFSGFMPEANVSGGSDGEKVLVFDNSMTKKKELEVGGTAASLTETFHLNAGEKVYVFFNKGGHHYSDQMTITELKMAQKVPELSEVAFTPKSTAGVKVANGAKYNQFFNVLNKSNAIGLWTGSYINETHAVGNLVPNADNSESLKLPAALQTGDNVWMIMWDGIYNATSPVGDYIIVDYFTAPAAGMVDVNATFAYDTPADQGDGVNVTVYKNRIAEENILIAKTLFDNASSARANTDNKGLSIKAENVSVAKGDVIIFVYDKNANYYSDSLVVLAKDVTYTDVARPAQIFTPDTTKVETSGSQIVALKGLTATDFIAALGADAKNVTLFKADGTPIGDAAGVVVDEIASAVFFNDELATCPIGVYSVTAEDTLPGLTEPEQEPVDDTGDHFMLPLVVGLMSLGALGCMTLSRKKK